MEKELFEKSGNACKIPYKNQCQMEENRSKRGKRPPRSLKKHYLEKVSASRFRQVEKPYKTNRKTAFWEDGKRIQNTLSKPMPKAWVWVQNVTIASEIIEKALAREGFLVAFLGNQKTLKTNRKTVFWEVRKLIQNTLQKPMPNALVLAQNGKMASKIIEKALAREGFRVAFLQSRKTL